MTAAHHPAALAEAFDALVPGGALVRADGATATTPPRTGRRIAVVGCGRGDLAIALALARPDHVVAGFDRDRAAVSEARSTAAAAGVSDRVTFEVADSILGEGYDLVYLPLAEPRGRNMP